MNKTAADSRSFDLNWDEVDRQAAGGRLQFASEAAYDPQQAANLLVAGACGSGKTTALQTMTYAALISGADVHVVDLGGTGSFDFARPYLRSYITTASEAERTATSLLSEVMRRRNLNANNGVLTCSQLPDDVRPNRIFVVVDELTYLMPSLGNAADSQKARMQRQADDDAKAGTAAALGGIARSARATGITLLLSVQRLSSRMLNYIPGVQDLTHDLARILLGGATYGERLGVLKHPGAAPEIGLVVPAGVGLWEDAGMCAKTVQVWAATGEDLAAHLLTRMPAR